jgi:DnaJ-domain-containing protein 1
MPKEFRKQLLFDFADRTYWNPGRTGNAHHTASTNADNTSHTKTAAKEPKHPDKYYQSCRVMELPDGFSRDELKAKYKELMKKYHPDLFATGDADVRHYAEEKAREINAAFEYLDNV